MKTPKRKMTTGLKTTEDKKIKKTQKLKRFKTQKQTSSVRKVALRATSYWRITPNNIRKETLKKCKTQKKSSLVRKVALRATSSWRITPNNIRKGKVKFRVDRPKEKEEEKKGRANDNEKNLVKEKNNATIPKRTLSTQVVNAHKNVDKHCVNADMKKKNIRQKRTVKPRLNNAIEGEKDEELINTITRKSVVRKMDSNTYDDKEMNDEECIVTPKLVVRRRIESDSEEEIMNNTRSTKRKRQVSKKNSEEKVRTSKRPRTRKSRSEEEGNSGGHEKYQPIKNSQKKKYRRIKFQRPLQRRNGRRVKMVKDFEESSDSLDHKVLNSNSDTEKESDADDSLCSDDNLFESYSNHSDIEKSKAEQDDEQLLKSNLIVVVQLIILKAANEEDEANEMTRDFRGKIHSVDTRIETVLNLCRSQAWTKKASTAIETYPEFETKGQRSHIEGGDFRHFDDCEVCTRKNHPWKYMVNFKGNTYIRDTFIQENDQVYNTSDLDLCFKMGRFCYERTRDYHRLFHWKFHLFQKIQTRLKTDDPWTIQKDQHFFTQTFTDLKNLMHRIQEDFTEDGKRGNKKYNEYVKSLI